MKKLAAIFLLLIFLFNVGGYRLWFYFEQQKSDKRIVAILDKEEYDDSELISIKIPLSLPYQTDWPEFERTDGEIEIEGIIYKYVKRKVENGELVLLCLPHHDKMQLNNARDDFFKYANDLAQNTSNKSPDNNGHNFKNPLSDYYLGSIGFLRYYLPVNDHNFKFFYESGNLVSVPHISPEQPPDVGSARINFIYLKV